MKIAVVLCVVVSVAWAGPVDSSKDKFYTDKYDHINFDEILSNDRLWNNFFSCLIIDGFKCTVEGRILKNSIQDAMTNGCQKCSAVQKTNTEKVLRYLLANRHEMYKKLIDKYDPAGLHKIWYNIGADKTNAKTDKTVEKNKEKAVKTKA